MLKKAIACLLVLAGVCSFHTSAADSKNEQFVNVNVFNKVYYGTVTKNADAGEAIFTPAGKSADFLQIEGRGCFFRCLCHFLQRWRISRSSVQRRSDFRKNKRNRP